MLDPKFGSKKKKNKKNNRSSQRLWCLRLKAGTSDLEPFPNVVMKNTTFGRSRPVPKKRSNPITDHRSQNSKGTRISSFSIPTTQKPMLRV